MADQPATKPSLLLRIRDRRDRASWLQFVEVYARHVYGDVRRQARELQISVAAVYLAKGRVLQRIKEQLQLLGGES